MTITPPPMYAEKRRELLERAIAKYVSKGYLVVSRTDSTAQLRKPKTFSCLFASLWFLLFGIGIVVYLIYYAAKRDAIIYIEVNEIGAINVRAA